MIEDVNCLTGRLEAAGVAITMDGHDRWLDTVFVELLWRSLEYGEVQLTASTPMPGRRLDHLLQRAVL